MAQFKDAQVSMLEEQEVFLFIHFLSSLAHLAKTQMTFHCMMNEVLKLDFLPLLVAKGYVSREKDILIILFRLASVQNFPNEKVASICSRTSSADIEQHSLKSLELRNIGNKNPRLVHERDNVELDLLIQRINGKLDNNEVERTVANIIEIYREKINFLNRQLSSLNSTLEQRSSEHLKQQQAISTLTKQSENREFLNWSLQLDKERLLKEFEDLKDQNLMIRKSVIDFQSRIDRVDTKNKTYEKTLMLKVKEIERELNIFYVRVQILNPSFRKQRRES